MNTQLSSRQLSLTQPSLAQRLIALPLLTVSFVGVSLLGAGSLPAKADIMDAKQDIVSKLEYCQKLDTPMARKECREKVRKYCAEKYPVAFCKAVFEQFKESQTSLPQPDGVKPTDPIDPSDLVTP